MSSILTSPDLMLALEMQRHRDSAVHDLNSVGTHNARAIFGMSVQSSSVFPYRSDCTKCDGTGEGIDSTFCPKCKGAGASRFIGMMQSAGQTILINDKLPRRFEPRPPSVPPAPMKGLV